MPRKHKPEFRANICRSEVNVGAFNRNLFLSLFYLDFCRSSFDRCKVNPKRWPLPEGAKFEVIVEGQPFLTRRRLEIEMPENLCDK